MTDSRKQNVSVRMSAGDLRKLKEIAKRLHAKDSDVFRFAIKNTLAKLAPLHEDRIRGSDLVPVFMEYGPEITHYFELDANRLDEIINEGVEDPKKRVAREDIELLAMAGVQESYFLIKLKELANKHIDPHGVSSFLRDYLFEKYVHSGATQLQVHAE